MYMHTYIRATVLGQRDQRVGAHSSFSDRKFPTLVGTSPLNSGFWLRRLPERGPVRGPAGERIRRAAAADAQFGDPRRASHVAERCGDGPAQANCREGHRAAAARRRALLGAAPREGAVRAFAARAVALERHAVGGCSPTAAEQPMCVHIVAALRVHLDAHIGAEGFSTVCASHVVAAHRIALLGL